jgi:hypothetical protein
MGTLEHLDPFPVLIAGGLAAVGAAEASVTLPLGAGAVLARVVLAVVLAVTLVLLGAWVVRRLT